MEQTKEQSSAAMPWRFQPGQSGNKAGRMSKAEKQARLDAKARELAEAYGGWEILSVVDRVCLEQAARLVLAKPRTYEDMVRHANSIRSILRLVERHTAANRPPERSFAEMIAVKHGSPLK